MTSQSVPTNQLQMKSHTYSASNLVPIRDGIREDKVARLKDSDVFPSTKIPTHIQGIPSLNSPNYKVKFLKYSKDVRDKLGLLGTS